MPRFDGWGYEDRNEVDSTSVREQVHTLSLTNTFYEDPVTAKALQDARAQWSLAAAHRILPSTLDYKSPRNAPVSGT